MWRFIQTLMRRNPAESTADSNQFRRSIRLTPTESGQALSAAGKVETCEESGWQRILIEVTAGVADGTPLMVLLNHLPAGSMVVSGGEADFELGVTGNEALPNGLPSVTEIKTVMVATRDGTGVLTGSFSGGNGRPPRG